MNQTNIFENKNFLYLYGIMYGDGCLHYQKYLVDL